MAMRTFLRCAATLAVIMLAACGTGGTPGSADPLPTAMSDAEVLTLGKRVAQCFRENGIPTFPDPTIEDGQLVLPEGVEEQIPEAAQEQAMRSCQSLFDQIPQSAIGGSGGTEVRGSREVPGPEDVEALRRFAECARQNGIPDWPDPKADGTFPLIGTPLEAEGKSERVIKVFEACQQHWSGGITYS
jgi:hypothetical protein